jgi:uncharacterized protein YcfL
MATKENEEPKMIKSILTASAISVALFGIGCKAVNTTERANPTYEADTLKIKNVVRDGYARDYAKVLEVRQATVPGDFLKVQVEVQNNNLRPGNIDYKFEWLDQNGMIINTPTSTWKTMQILTGETKSLDAVAPTPMAKDFRLKLERSRRG